MEITPIECVLEDIRKRIRKIESESHPAVGAPSLKTLNQVLSGSVNVQVHGGTKEVADSFLGPGADNDRLNPVHVHELKRELATFLRVCGAALAVSKRLSARGEDNDRAFQAVLEKGYASLQVSVGELIHRIPQPAGGAGAGAGAIREEKEGDTDEALPSFSSSPSPQNAAPVADASSTATAAATTTTTTTTTAAAAVATCAAPATAASESSPAVAAASEDSDAASTRLPALSISSEAARETGFF